MTLIKTETIKYHLREFILDEKKHKMIKKVNRFKIHVILTAMIWLKQTSQIWQINIVTLNMVTEVQS